MTVFNGQAVSQSDDILSSTTDKFDRLIVGETDSQLDIASHYPASPERWRIFVSGTRQFLQYNNVSQYNHNNDVHELKPNGGETVVLETSERPRYVVQYEFLVSFAFSINQSLNSGDKLKVGLFDGDNGWFLEHNGGHGDKEVDLVSLRGGAEKYRETNQPLSKALTSFTRVELKTPWYNVGSQDWKQTLVESNTQKTKDIAEVGLEDDRGPEVGNLPARFEIQAASGTSNLQLNAGSIGVVTLGESGGKTRIKTVPNTISVSTTGSWEPILAIRKDPNRDIINTQFVDVEILEFGGSGDIQLLVQSHDPSKVLNGSDNELTDSDYSTPATMSSQGSVIEESTNLTQAADSTGSTTSSTSDPGGFQIGYASLYTSGNSSNAPVQRGETERKRALFKSDVAVVWVNAGATGDVTFEYTVEQDW